MKHGRVLPETYRFLMTTRDGATVNAGPLVSSVVTNRRHEIQHRRMAAEVNDDVSIAAMQEGELGPWSTNVRDVVQGIYQAVWDLFGPDEMWRFMSHCDAVWDSLLRGDVPDNVEGIAS